MEIVALDFGGTVDTVEFNKVDRRSLWESVQPETSHALELVRSGVEKGDPVLVGQGSSISAIASQQVLPKPHLAAMALMEWPCSTIVKDAQRRLWVRRLPWR